MLQQTRVQLTRSPLLASYAFNNINQNRLLLSVPTKSKRMTQNLNSVILDHTWLPLIQSNIPHLICWSPMVGMNLASSRSRLEAHYQQLVAAAGDQVTTQVAWESRLNQITKWKSRQTRSALQQVQGLAGNYSSHLSPLAGNAVQLHQLQKRIPRLEKIWSGIKLRLSLFICFFNI
jgi:hypothetical protein